MNNQASGLITGVIFLAIAGCNSADNDTKGAALLEARCGVCHSIDIPKNARKSKKEWDTCLTRMISKGANLSADEKKTLVRYLAGISGL